MNPNIADLIADELRASRRKLDHVVELLGNYVGDESHSIYLHLSDAGAALEAAEAEVVRLKTLSEAVPGC